MNILVACEESQRVCLAFREKGHNAFSCDIEECSGGHPEYHINRDVIPLLNGNCSFYTMDGELHTIKGKWDMIIAFPPCTQLCSSGQRWFTENVKPRSIQKDAIDFFFKFVNADCDKIVIENPVGIMSTKYRKPNQIINPYNFGEPFSKRTCLWLKGVEPLKIKYKNKPMNCTSYAWYTVDDNGKVLGWSTPEIKRQRSRTFNSIALAMAEQWG